MAAHQPKIKPQDLDSAWSVKNKSKYIDPLVLSYFAQIKEILAEMNEIHSIIISERLNIEQGYASSLLGMMQKDDIIKKMRRKVINGQDVRIYVSTAEKTAFDHMAEIEYMADDGDVCESMVVNALNITPKQAKDYLARLTKSKALQIKNKRFIDGKWHLMYGEYVEPPKQVSMLPTRQVVRDSLVAALFGNDNRDSEAAWVF